MIATIEYIQKKFDEYNKLCFEGQLQPLPIKLSNARTFLGQVTCKRVRNFDGTWCYYDFVFRINTKIDRPEKEVEDTILHEMIHYWILYNQMQDTSIHGKIFRKKMNEINSKYNRNLSISHKTTKEEHDKDTEKRRHVICVSKLQDGRIGITIAAHTRLSQLWDIMPEFPGVIEQKWVLSTDPFFNRFPRAISPKIYPVNPEELEEHLKDAKELFAEGNTIMVKKS